ncbi:guanitoxin biosynthesis pre-guanitoxin forming N-methyltransferase GntF [Povalibacter sp.]|uniref:guanitoxin biosynthesis pre-guanitoxin forming N-methyltransferase GntF n=1 Tax=Povalibacter sp. TaxID=1962978 RepID=UPI002F3FA4A3
MLREHAADFDRWSADDYLHDYYSRVETEEEHTLEFLVKQCARIPVDATILEFGCGPTLHHVLPFSHRAAEIHLADLLPANLEAIRRWQSRDPGAHDWREFTRRVLRFEGLQHPTRHDIQCREEVTRAVISRRIVADAQQPRRPGALTRRYDCVVSCYCADSATADKREWRRFMHNIAGLVSPGGLLLVAALRRCKYYSVGNQTFPSAHIDEHDLTSVFRDLRLSDVDIDVVDVPDRSNSGFDSILLASATMREVSALDRKAFDKAERSEGILSC